jgi:hypothetical protein
MTLGAARRKRQHRVQPIQRLNGSLLVDTEHRRMLGRTDVKPNNIGGFGFKIGIIAGHVAFQPVWLQTGFVPGAVHGIFADTKSRGKLAATPVSRSLLRLLSSSREYPGPQGRGQHGGRLQGSVPSSD